MPWGLPSTAMLLPAHKHTCAGQDPLPQPPSMPPSVLQPVVAGLSSDLARQQHLASPLCQALQEHPKSAWRHLYRSEDADFAAMADLMYAEFWRRTSPQAVPVVQEVPNSDAEYLGFQSVKVSLPGRRCCWRCRSLWATSAGRSSGRRSRHHLPAAYDGLRCWTPTGGDEVQSGCLLHDSIMLLAGPCAALCMGAGQ